MVGVVLLDAPVTYKVIELKEENVNSGAKKLTSSCGIYTQKGGLCSRN